MKVIYIKNNIIVSQKVEKSWGIFDKIRNIFRRDNTTTRKVIDDVQQQMKDEEFEKKVAQEVLSDKTNYETLEPDQVEEASNDQLKAIDAINSKTPLKIGYFTYTYNTYIERNILPMYLKYAKTTGNKILVSWCYDWNDYRAFVLDNIVFSTALQK